MRKIILLLIVLVFVSCSSDEGLSNPNTAADARLVKIVETIFESNTVNTTNFTFLDDNLIKSELVKSNGDIFVTEFVYVNNKLTKLKYFDNNFPSSEVAFNYTGNLITSSSGIEDVVNYVHIYEYNSTGNLIKDSQYDNDFLSSVSTFTHDESGNITSFSNNDFGTATYTYDNKKNPFWKAYGSAYLKRLDIGYTINNMTNQTYSNSTQISSEYVYNSNNYPVEKIVKYNGTPASRTIYTYN